MISGDNHLVKLQEQPYLLESNLQQLLASYPDLIPGDQINTAEPRRWLFVAREANLPLKEGGAWLYRVDHLFLDQDAVPTLVEVKLSSNPEIYQHIVSQLLAYAANASSAWTTSILKDFFERTHIEPEQKLAEFLGEEVDPDQFWQQAETNLRAGKLRLIFLADKLPDELLRVVEFLNAQMSPAEVLAVELRQYANADAVGNTIIVPKLIGQTAQTQQRKSGGSGSRKRRNEAAFLEDLQAKNDPETVAVATKILRWATDTMSLPIWWGSGEGWIAFVPKFTWHGVDHWFVWVSSNANFEIIFNQMRGKNPFGDNTLRLQLLNRLNTIPGMDFPPNAINQRPKRSLSILLADDALSKFLDIFDWYIKQIKEADDAH